MASLLHHNPVATTQDWSRSSVNLRLELNRSEPQVNSNKGQDTRFNKRFSGASKACLRPRCRECHKGFGFLTTLSSSQTSHQAQVWGFHWLQDGDTNLPMLNHKLGAPRRCLASYGQSPKSTNPTSLMRKSSAQEWISSFLIKSLPFSQPLTRIS